MEIKKYKNYDFNLLEINERNPLIVALLLVGINIISFLALIIFLSVQKIDNPFLKLTVPTVISFIIMPKLLLKFLKINDNIDAFRYLKTSILVFISFLLVYIFTFRAKLKMDFMFFWIIHYLFVATGEEYIYRHLLINLLGKKMSVIASCIVSSFVFAFILHNNEALITNLFCRLPLALILSGVYVRTRSLSLPIIIHTIYDLIVMVI
ncbi:CPBP family intramembrane glutamic endopeptidase [Anaerococcus nagyae]|uniref:CPBP family intramembrane glutamic endopeptidase n=1 Tax=Anaerococcus nagyae TaxID=1755241 RepID=UPI003736EE76